MKIIFLGAPGSGKGTLSEAIVNHYKIKSISTGNLIRETLKSGSDLGERLKSYVKEGKLVPDEIVIEMIKNRVFTDEYKNGFILDGFPRTIGQAEALEDMEIKIDRVIDINVPEDLIISRISGRRVCQDCGATYHIENKKSNKEGVCDNCSGTLIKRKDDQEETIKNRLQVYKNETLPLKKYYEEKGKLVEVDGVGTVSETTSRAIEAAKV